MRDPEQPAQPNAGVAALVLIGNERRQAVDELHRRDVERVVLGDAEALPHHLGERPVRRPLGEGEAVTAVPEQPLGQAVRVLLEFPPESGLADTGGAADDEQSRAAPVGARVVELLDRAQFGVAPDERRLQPVDALLATDVRLDARRLPQRDEVGLALERVLADVDETDARSGEALRRAVDPDGARCRRGLDACGGVHRVAGHHALADGTDADGHLAGHHAGAQRQPARADLPAQRRHGADEFESRSHGAFGVALHRDRRTPHGHDRVADELLDAAAVARNDGARRVEVPRQQLADLLRVTRFRERREADEIGEQDGADAAFGDRAVHLGEVGRLLRRCRGDDLGTAQPAEPEARPGEGAARRARHRQPRPALRAEAVLHRVRRAACRAGQHPEIFAPVRPRGRSRHAECQRVPPPLQRLPIRRRTPRVRCGRPNQPPACLRAARRRVAASSRRVASARVGAVPPR